MNRKIVIIAIICLMLSSCINQTPTDEKINLYQKVQIDSSLLVEAGFDDMSLPENYDLTQFQGMTLNFIVENNLHATILSHESEKFSEVTGININIKAMDYDTLFQKLNLDFISRSGEYQIVYVDPYQTLNRFSDYLEILNAYNENPNMPKIEGFMDDFFETQTVVSAYFNNEDNIYTIPFDSTTMILYYRKDLFEKYKDAFYADMGYDWTPGTKEFTWERYIEVSKWIDKNVPDEEVKYGSGHMAQEHNSIFCDFSNILAAYGGDYFTDRNINTLGLETFSKINTKNENFIQALDMYKKVIEASAPESENWNWSDSANAFRNGEIAMIPNWDENYTYFEHDSESKIKGKVGYAIMPYGDVRSANIYGGSGIGINKYASLEEKKAAWLYITWATTKEMQLKVLKHPEGGSLPTRKSAYNDEVVKSYIINPNYYIEGQTSLKHIRAVQEAWKIENIYLRPKISNFYDVEKIIVSNLHEMVAFNIKSEVVANKIYDELSQIQENIGVD